MLLAAQTPLYLRENVIKVGIVTDNSLHIPLFIKAYIHAHTLKVPCLGPWKCIYQ